MSLAKKVVVFAQNEAFVKLAVIWARNGALVKLVIVLTWNGGVREISDCFFFESCRKVTNKSNTISKIAKKLLHFNICLHRFLTIRHPSVCHTVTEGKQGPNSTWITL